MAGNLLVDLSGGRLGRIGQTVVVPFYHHVDFGDVHMPVVSVIGVGPVSYTHLDVYKRQLMPRYQRMPTGWAASFSTMDPTPHMGSVPRQANRKV